jgi:hypothetical protein
VLGQARDRNRLEAVPEGWQDVCPQPDSMTWLRHRAAALGGPEEPALSLARAPVPQRHDRWSGRVSRRGRRVALSPSARAYAKHRAYGSVSLKAGVPSPSTVEAERGVAERHVRTRSR